MQKEADATIYAIKLLSKRDYSVHKLTRKLAERGFEQEEVQATIQHLLEKRYLREELYTEARVKGLARKNYSITYIQSKLREENVTISPEEIENIMFENKMTPEKQISDLIQKKLSSMDLEDPNSHIKTMRFLLSKGHDYASCKKLLARAVDELSE